MYRRDGELHKYVDKDNIYLSVSDVEINTEIDLRAYTGHTVCMPAYIQYKRVCENKIAERITALQNV
jgi:hypothetical protein